MCRGVCGACSGFEVLVVQLGAKPSEYTPWRVKHAFLEGASPSMERLRELLQVDEGIESAIRGVATCRDCGHSRLLWFGSPYDARWHRSVILDELDSDTVVEIRKLTAMVTLQVDR